MAKDEIAHETRAARAELIIPTTAPEADFCPQHDESCFCGSTKSFDKCCGSQELDRPPPYGVFVHENYLSDDMCRKWVEYADAQPGERLLVIDHAASTPNNIVKVVDPRRVAERVELGSRRADLINQVRDIMVDLARKSFGVELDWYEAPEMMRYRPGGFYVKHADSQNFDPHTELWSKVIDRDISLLLYLNDAYTGGLLSFEKFNYRLRPRAGMAVVFPSDSRYLHTAQSVDSGVRYAVVSWAAVKGVRKISPIPPEPAIRVSL